MRLRIGNCRSILNLLVQLPLMLFLGSPPCAYSTVFFVDQNNYNSDDINPGSRELPFKTIAAAMTMLKAGDTVQVGTGTYREMVCPTQGGESEERPVTLRALPNAQVFIKGSDTVSDWIPHNRNIWKRIDWKINSQQVFVDGVSLQQIGRTCPLNLQYFEKKPLLPPVGDGLKDMKPGTFYYSEREKILFVWLIDDTDPNGHLIEAAVRDFLIPPQKLDYIKLENLNFAHSNLTSKGLIMGMVNVWGNFWTITDCTFTQSDFAGISIIGEGHEITNCKFNNNGNLGISINGSDEAHKWAPVPNRSPQNIILAGNATSYNNYRKFELSWQHGGIKAAVSCNGITVINHNALDNFGAGIWFDIYCQNITICESSVSNNLLGIMYEISDNAIISNNLVTGNKYHGIYVAASNNVKIFNNTIDNNSFGIVLHGLPRPEHPTLNNNQVLNNIISESRMADLVLYKNHSWAKNNISNYNLFVRIDKEPKISWTADRRYNITHSNLLLFATASGQDTHSLNADPLWVDRKGGDFNLKPGSPAACAGIGNAVGRFGMVNLKMSNINRKRQDCAIGKVNIGAF